MNFSDRQRSGATVIVIAATLFYSAFLISPYCPDRFQEHPWVIQAPQSRALEVSLGSRYDGVYFFDTKADLEAVLQFTGLSLRLPQSLFAEMILLKKRGYRACTDGEVVRLTTLSAATAFTLGLPIDLNNASLEDLIQVPGIGEKTAAAIVSYRQKWGPFRSLAEVKRVPGIRFGRLKNLDAYLEVIPKNL